MKSVIEIIDVFIDPVDGKRVLKEVIGSDAEKISLPCAGPRWRQPGNLHQYTDRKLRVEFLTCSRKLFLTFSRISLVVCISVRQEIMGISRRQVPWAEALGWP